MNYHCSTQEYDGQKVKRVEPDNLKDCCFRSISFLRLSKTPRTGLEPATFRLTVCCSTIELSGNVLEYYSTFLIYIPWQELNLHLAHRRSTIKLQGVLIFISFSCPLKNQSVSALTFQILDFYLTSKN